MQTTIAQNLKAAAHNRETVTIAGGHFSDRQELSEAARAVLQHDPLRQALRDLIAEARPGLALDAARAVYLATVAPDAHREAMRRAQALAEAVGDPAPASIAQAVERFGLGLVLNVEDGKPLTPPKRWWVVMFRPGNPAPVYLQQNGRTAWSLGSARARLADMRAIAGSTYERFELRAEG